ncbi:unnamed protein product [Effrenium voratum]|uniref:Uncharacterized protein n=1 Tax=Effrenium voratum TaxID=2562239 RepID=A0AA36IVW4_9DINO|nr:unnamed protein product [Effrenium voratum]
MAPLQATVAPSEALRQLVTGEGTEQQVSEAVRALDPATPSPERLWASVAQLLGLSDESRVATYDELSECPDCMMLWGFRSIYGAEEPLPDASPVLQLARQHRLPEGLAAYALAAQLGSPLGRLAWGEERLGSAPALQRRGSLQPPEDISSNSCAEGLEAAMAVAATAAQEQSSVPQPVDMDYLIQARHEDRQSYALASQLARDGHAEGLAAKAEMLYYGKSAVVSEGYLSAWCWVLPLLIWVLPKLCRREATRVTTGCACVSLLPPILWFYWLSGGPADLAQDVGLAQDLFQEAAEAGHWGAAYAMALIKLDENHSEAQPYLEQVVEQGEEPASSFADYFRHRHGLGVDKDPDRAGQLLERAADMGEPTAQALLAELLTKQEHQDAKPPGGFDPARALHYFRQAAGAGQLPCRYNIGVLLLQSDAVRSCLEARQEFLEVARDMEPTVRLLFALALRAWERGNAAAALQLFTFLSELGVTKAHRNAARLWEQRIGTDRTLDLPAEEAEETCSAEVELVATGQYCSGFRFNEPGFLPSECVKMCSQDPECSFATTYTTGYCQLSGDCAMGAAADPSAQIYAVRGACRSGPSARLLRDCAPWQASPRPRLCAALFWARAAEFPAQVQSELPAGSALAEAAKTSAVAAASAGRHLEWLDLGAAFAWSCRAGQLGSGAGRLRCAALQAEAWPGHVANLSLAARELRHLANDEAHAAVAVYATLGSLLARFWHRAVLQGCRLPPSVALPRCDQLAEAAGSSGVRLDQAAQLATERVLLMCLLMLTALLLCLLWLGLRFVQQLTIAVAKIEEAPWLRELEPSAFVLQRIPSFAVRIGDPGRLNWQMPLFEKPFSGEVLKELDVNDTVPDKTTLSTTATPTSYTVTTKTMTTMTSTSTSSSNFTTTTTTQTRTTSTTTSTKDTRPIWSDDILFQESSAPLFTFYMYRAVGDTVYPPMNVNAANLAGVMWYLHNEVVERTPRKFGITKIIRFKVQTRATQPLWEKGMNFGVRFAFDSGQATGPFECGRDKYGPKLCQGPFNRSFDVGMHNGSVVGAFEWDTYGYFVGCNKLGHFPFPTYKIYYPGAVWWSLPGPCPSKNYTDWTDWCKEREPGGYCDETPTGQGNCTWTYEDAGEITIDELTGIRNYSAFMASGRKEYMRGPDRGFGWTWWDSKKDVLANEWRLMLAQELFAKKYPNSTPEYELHEPECDFNMRKFYEDKGYYVAECEDAKKGDACYRDVIWAMREGIKRHPEWYRGLTPDSSFEDFQGYLYRTSPVGHSCKPPCS